MIYYYFCGKAQIYAAVLEEMYGSMRDAEAAFQFEALPAYEAIRRLVEVTFDHGHAHPEFVRLVVLENTEEARNVRAART